MDILLSVETLEGIFANSSRKIDAISYCTAGFPSSSRKSSNVDGDMDGLNGDVQLLEDRDKQNKLDDWKEHQDYELREYDRLEKNLNKAQARLASKRQKLPWE